MATVYVVGHGKTQQDNPIQNQYKGFFMTFHVDVQTDTILDTSGTFVLAETTAFVKSLFVGQAMTSPIEAMREMLEKRYWGSSQKAILVAFRDAQKQYMENKTKHW